MDENARERLRVQRALKVSLSTTSDMYCSMKILIPMSTVVGAKRTRVGRKTNVWGSIHGSHDDSRR